MSNKVQEFLNDNFGQVRIIENNKVLWFIADDVAKVLGYVKATDMTRNLDEDETDKQSLRIRSDNGIEQDRLCLIINESGLYNAVLSITKRNKERYNKAKKFKKWITSEVIPTIRNTGAYIEEEREEEVVEKYFSGLSEETKKAMVIDLMKNNKKLQVKADKWDRFLETDGTYTFTETCKLISTMAKEESSDIKISATKLTEFLREKGILSKNKNGKKYTNVPNKDYEDKFNVSSVKTNGGFNTIQTKVNSTGVEFIYDLLKQQKIS